MRPSQNTHTQEKEKGRKKEGRKKGAVSWTAPNFIIRKCIAVAAQMQTCNATHVTGSCALRQNQEPEGAAKTHRKLFPGVQI